MIFYVKQEFHKHIRDAASDDKNRDEPSSSSGDRVIRDVRDVKHPTGKVPLYSRLMEEHRKLSGEEYCPGYPCEDGDCYRCEEHEERLGCAQDTSSADPETEGEDVTEDEEEVGCAQAGDAGAQGATGDAGGDAGDGTAGPKPSKRWKLLARSNVS